mmetsp:Transcript_48625/g.135567  ORF Transcript_48625/g.135567 Transcript_48625/m.135567 type:complete len:241 (+) Transcript_48625:1960-2682(+)
MCMNEVKHTSAGMSCSNSASTASCGNSPRLARAALTERLGIWPVELRSLSNDLRTHSMSCSRIILISLKNSSRSMEPFPLKSTRLIREDTSSTLVVLPRYRSRSSTCKWVSSPVPCLLNFWNAALSSSCSERVKPCTLWAAPINCTSASKSRAVSFCRPRPERSSPTASVSMDRPNFSAMVMAVSSWTRPAPLVSKPLKQLHRPCSMASRSRRAQTRNSWKQTPGCSAESEGKMCANMSM